MRPGETVSGEMRLVAHSRQSYDVHVSLRAPGVLPGAPQQVSTGVFDLKEPYYRQLVAGANWNWPVAAEGGVANGGEHYGNAAV